MIISKAALMFVSFMIVFSVFVANVANLISVDLPYESKQENREFSYEKSDNNRTLSDSLDHLIWFLQISDIHISEFQDRSRITDLREFCDVTISTVKPKVVLASGDLTDAKTKDHIGSKQIEEEWKYYSSVLNDCKVNQKTKWLDIRGNHDNFNVANINSRENFYRNYSMQGKHHDRSYMYQLESGDDIYSFIGVDACVDPGPRRPFNFVGIVGENEVKKIQKLAEDARARGSKYIIWFGHFPTSCILTSGSAGIRPIFGQYPESKVYVCGHLHTLGGLVTNMYTLQKAGFLELELGDWKDNRVVRLMAIDHGLFTFIDTKHNEWPLILITNPKHALYANPKREPLEKILHSTHIRVLAFSVSEIKNVSVKINNENWIQCNHIDGPLYVARWNPTSYRTGLHTIQVNVKDIHGRDKTITQPFSLDNSRLSYNILGRFALMTNASTVFQFLFGALVITCVAPLCILRCLHKLAREKKMNRPISQHSCCRRWVRKLWSLVTVDRLFYPTVLYPIYLCVGPWSAGYIIEEHFGVIFAWGIFVRGAFLPGSFTYAYGFLQLITFQFPFTFILANCVNYRVECVKDSCKIMKKWHRKFLFHFPFYLIMAVQILFAYFFWLAYGTIAFLLGPLRTWSIIYALIMWWQALHLPEKCCRETMLVWHCKSKVDSTDDEQEIGNIST